MGNSILESFCPNYGRLGDDMGARMKAVFNVATTKPEELEDPDRSLSILSNFLPLSGQWFLMNHDLVGEPWTDSGFDPSVASIPREMLCVWACLYGVPDIDNGGLAQFFLNFTGAAAPEMVEGFQILEMPECAKVIERAIGVFNGRYSRSQTARRPILDQLGEAKGGWSEIFSELDEQLGNAGIEKLNDQADQFLKTKYGIKTAKERPWPRKEG